MSRRLLLFGLLAASQLSTGCWCVRERIAWRWHNHHPAACGPVCATPAFRIPSQVIGSPVGGGPVYGGHMMSGPAPGCSTCTSGIDAGPAYPGPMSYMVPAGGHGAIGAPPIIGPAMPLGAPRVETVPQGGNAKN